MEESVFVVKFAVTQSGTCVLRSLAKATKEREREYKPPLPLYKNSDSTLDSHAVEMTFVHEIYVRIDCRVRWRRTHFHRAESNGGCFETGVFRLRWPSNVKFRRKKRKYDSRVCRFRWNTGRNADVDAERTPGAGARAK